MAQNACFGFMFSSNGSGPVRTTLLDFTGGEQPEVDSLRGQGRLPPWLGLEALHVSPPLVADPQGARALPAVLPRRSRRLLAALCLPGSTLWLSPHAGPSDFTAPPLAELQPGPVERRAGKVSASIARPPTEQDLAALAREATEPPEFAFHRPLPLLDDAVGALVRKEPPSLIVLDGVSQEEARTVLDATAPGPVVLGIGGHLARKLPEAVRTAPNG
jgi:hypothetical protein